MRKFIFALFLWVVWTNFSCGSAASIQNQENNLQSLSPTPIAKSEDRPSQEFIDHYHKGINIWSNGKRPDDLPKAIEEFRKAAESDPKNTTAYGWMIKLYSVLKDYNAIEDCYRQILKRDPKDLEAQWGLAYVLVWDLKRYEEGLKEAQIAKEKKATYSWAIEETIGKAYEGMGDIPTAIKHYKQYLRDFRGMKNTDSTLYKDMQKKVAELEKKIQNSNSNQNP